VVVLEVVEDIILHLEEQEPQDKVMLVDQEDQVTLTTVEVVEVEKQQ
tara:strand:+ start:108 stop:248 length:141 start_codon:yes stop_codon:yes gene_type:complete